MPIVRRGIEFVEEWRKMWEPDMEAIAFNGATCDPTRVDPKVLQWVKSNCAKKPHFIKVINETAALGWLPPPGARNPGRQQCKMTVPRPFVREHFRKLGRVITLENGTTHKKWRVSFGTANMTPSWLQGWKGVVIGNQLTAGDVMIFVLTGDSHFVFHLFDELGLPKVHFEAPAVKIEPKCNLHTHVDDAVNNSVRIFDKCKSKLFDPDIVKLEPGGRRADKGTVSSEEAAWYPNGAPGGVCGAKKVGSSLPASELTDTDMAEATRQRTTPMRREGSAIRTKAAGHGVNSAHHHHRQPLDWLSWILIKSRRRIPTTMERKRAMEQAKAHAELLVGNQFLVVLSDTQVYRDFHLPLPERFVSDWGLPKSRTRLTLADRSGREWEMYSRGNSSGGVALNRKHWGLFALQHRLEEGDVCVFQLINKDTFIISVCIFRVVKLDRSNVSIREHYDMRMKPLP